MNENVEEKDEDESSGAEEPQVTDKLNKKIAFNVNPSSHKDTSNIQNGKDYLKVPNGAYLFMT